VLGLGCSYPILPAVPADWLGLYDPIPNQLGEHRRTAGTTVQETRKSPRRYETGEWSEMASATMVEMELVLGGTWSLG